MSASTCCEPMTTDSLGAANALIARFSQSSVEPRAFLSIQDWVAAVTRRLTAAEACTVAGHVFGVVPLLDALFDAGAGWLAAARAGATVGGLGVFTPAPEEGWGGAPLVGDVVDGALRVRGEVRVPSSASQGSIALVQTGRTDRRLVWIDHESIGVRKRRDRFNGVARADEPLWLIADGATIPNDRISRSVGLEPDGALYEQLERYAAVWSLIALEYARTTVHQLRRVARTTRRGGDGRPFSASQVVMMELGALEIETELTTLFANEHFTQQAPHPSGLVLALAAARTVERVGAKASELCDHLGLLIDDALVDPHVAMRLTAHVGGVLTLENELARFPVLGCATSHRTA